MKFETDTLYRKEAMADIIVKENIESTSFKLQPKNLKVLLSKGPDIGTPKFLEGYVFGVSTKSTLPGGDPGPKSWDLGGHIVPWGVI